MENETPQTGDESSQAADKAQYAPDQLSAGRAMKDASGKDVNLDLVLDIPVEVTLRVGSTDISIRDLVSLVEGSVISLDQAAGAPMEVLVNGTLIANGEIVIVDDQYGVRLLDVVTPIERVEKLN